MALPKNYGKANNPHGRPAGIPNRSTEELRRVIQSFIDVNIDRLQADFDSLEPKERLIYLEKLLGHVLPKPISSIDQLTETDIDMLILKLKENEKEQ